MAGVFQRIVDRELPAEIVHQDELVTAFKDINPAAPVHVLIVPNREIASLDGLGGGDGELAGRLLLTAARLARQLGIAETGYRVIVNTGRHGGQEVPHLHLHLVGGRPLGPMLDRRQV